MSNKNNKTVLVYRPMGGDEDPTTRRLTPYYDIYTQCEIINWSYREHNPLIIFTTIDGQGKSSKIVSVGLPFTIVEDINLFSQEGCTCPETDGKSCPIPAHQPARPENR